MKPRTIILIICGVILLSLLIFFSVPLKDWLLRIIFEELQHRLVGVILAVVLGIAQLLCFFSKRLPIRLIPVYFILLGYLLCLILFFGMEGLGKYIAAMILGIMFSIALSGVVLAWLIYGGFRLFFHLKKRSIIE